MFLSPYLSGYRKRFKAQQALLAWYGNWEKVLDNKGFGRAVLMDLSKVFDTIYRNLFITYLAYDFVNGSLKLLYSCLNNRWHRTKNNQNFSSWKELNEVAPQGSVLGYAPFNIYLNDLFFLSEFIDLSNFALHKFLCLWYERISFKVPIDIFPSKWPS